MTWLQSCIPTGLHLLLWHQRLQPPHHSSDAWHPHSSGQCWSCLNHLPPPLLKVCTQVSDGMSSHLCGFPEPLV